MRVNLHQWEESINSHLPMAELLRTYDSCCNKDMIGDISFDISDGQHMFIITDKQSTDGNQENSDILEKDFV